MEERAGCVFLVLGSGKHGLTHACTNRIQQRENLTLGTSFSPWGSHMGLVRDRGWNLKANKGQEILCFLNARPGFMK
jgi:hypothetical protein